MATWLAHGVRVHSSDGCTGESTLDFHLQLLRANAAITNVGILALRTIGWRWDRVVAVVTNRFTTIVMMGQWEVAVGAGYHKTTVRTLNGGCKASSIQKQDHLTVVSQRPLDGFVKWAAYSAFVRIVPSIS